MFHLWKNQVDGFTSKMCEKQLWKNDILSKDVSHRHGWEWVTTWVSL